MIRVFYENNTPKKSSNLCFEQKSLQIFALNKNEKNCFKAEDLKLFIVFLGLFLLFSIF